MTDNIINKNDRLPINGISIPTNRLEVFINVGIALIIIFLVVNYGVFGYWVSRPDPLLGQYFVSAQLIGTGEIAVIKEPVMSTEYQLFGQITARWICCFKASQKLVGEMTTNGSFELVETDVKESSLRSDRFEWMIERFNNLPEIYQLSPDSTITIYESKRLSTVICSINKGSYYLYL